MTRTTLFFLITAFLLTASISQADSSCESRITYLAKEAMAAEMDADDDDIELVEYRNEAWTGRRGSAVVTLIHRVYSGKGGPDTYANVRVNAVQNGTACTITGTAVTFAE